MKKITLLITSCITVLGFSQAPTTPAPSPTQAQGDVVSVFSDAFTGDPTLTPTTFGQHNNTAAVINTAGNDVYEFTIVDGDFQGFELGNSIDLSAMETLHYDIWISGPVPAGNVFNTTVSQHNNGHLTGQSTGYVNTNATIASGDEGQWLSFDIDFDQFTPNLETGRKDIISQLVFSYTNYTSSNTIYLDNLYFYRAAVNAQADASLSDLQIDGTTIANFASTGLSYNLELPNGTTTVPTVSATATQATAQVNITQATSVNGIATVDVTAPDGTTTLQYTVNFTEAAFIPDAAPQFLSNGTNLIVYSDIAPGAGDNSVTGFVLNQFGDGVRGEVDLDQDSNNDTFRLENVNFYGAGWDPVDLTALPYTFVHVNYFAVSVNEFRFFLIDASAGIPGGNPEEPRFVVSNSGNGDAALVQGSWQSAFMPLSVFENFPTPSFNYDLNDIGQYKFETTGGVMYFDNVFFSTDNTLSNESIVVNSLLVSPNPTTDFWRFQDPLNSIQEIAVYDMTGKLVLTQTPKANAATVNASALKSGIYLAQVTTDNGKETIKLVKK